MAYVQKNTIQYYNKVDDYVVEENPESILIAKETYVEEDNTEEEEQEIYEKKQLLKISKKIKNKKHRKIWRMYVNGYRIVDIAKTCGYTSSNQIFKILRGRHGKYANIKPNIMSIFIKAYKLNIGEKELWKKIKYIVSLKNK